MNATSFLEQLLQTGSSALGNATQAANSPDGRKYVTGAAVGGVLGLLLGSRSGRSMGGKVLKMGSVMALGALAWKAYDEWQRNQAGGAAPAAAPAGAASPAPATGGYAALPAPQADEHARALLKAMIAAAKSDGHLDEAEQSQLEAELQRVQADSATRDWVQTELRRPVDPADVAAAVTGPEMAAEVYLASVLVVDETTVMERAYLDELARQLRLAPSLQSDLEARARAA